MKYIFERIFFDFVLHYNLLTNIKKYSRWNILLKTIYLLCIQKQKKKITISFIFNAYQSTLIKPFGGN